MVMQQGCMRGYYKQTSFCKKRSKTYDSMKGITYPNVGLYPFKFHSSTSCTNGVLQFRTKKCFKYRGTKTRGIPSIAGKG